MLLTAELFDRARRRLGELPDHAATRWRSSPKPTASPPSTSSWSSEPVYLEPRPIGPPSARVHSPRSRSRSRCLAALARASCGRRSGDSGRTARASAWRSRRLAWAGFLVCGASIRSGSGKPSRRPEPRRSPRSRNRGCTARSRSATGSRRGFGIRSAAASIRGTATERLRSSAARSNDAGSGIAHQSTCTRTTGLLSEARRVFSRSAGSCTFDRRWSREAGSLSRLPVPIA